MKIIFTCGGTGGHIYPAISVYREFVKHDPENKNEYLFVGSDYGLEKNIFQTENIPFAEFICSRGIRRELTIRNIHAFFCNLKAISQAKKIFNNFKPDIVIGTGGYPAYHITRLAKRTGTPYFLIEGNILPGLVTKMFYKEARVLFVSTGKIKDYLADIPNIKIVGVPSRYTVPQSKKNKKTWKTVTVMGGSCGSEVINSSMYEMISGYCCDHRIIWATGKKDYENIRGKITNIPDNVEITDYINNMPDILAETDLIISRAGAMTIQEIRDYKLPAILVPFSKAAGNHQYINALFLKDMGVAEIISEDALNAEVLKNAIDNFLSDRVRLDNIAEIYNEEISEDCNKKIYDTILEELC